jgi:hypothetical protein
MVSLSLLISSMAPSQLTERISQASLPQVASRSLSLSVVCRVLVAAWPPIMEGHETHQDAEPVQQLSGMWVDTAAVLEAAKLVQLVHHLDCDAVRVLEIGLVLLLVGAQVGDDILVVQQPRDLARLGLELVASLQHLVALRLVLVGHVVQVVHVLVQLAHKVGHVGGLEQLQQQLLLLERLFGILVGGEVEQRVDEVAVEVGHELGQEAVLFGDIAAVCR